MDVEHITAFARERLGMDIQATSHAQARAAGSRALEVWSLMTEHGHFWLVEEAGEVELGRGTRTGALAADVAIQRFLELHPTGPARPAAAYDCRTCGVQVTPRRPHGQTERQLCARCYHIERERERYQNDPDYRARRLGRKRDRNRVARERGGS